MATKWIEEEIERIAERESNVSEETRGILITAVRSTLSEAPLTTAEGVNLAKELLASFQTSEVANAD